MRTSAKTWLAGIGVLAFVSLVRVAAGQPLAEKMTVTLGGDVKMDFVLIQPGKFMMGSDKGDPDEKPAHEVTIAKPFYMAVNEVTQLQWKALIGDNPSGFKGDDLPVEKVSWDDGQRFLVKLKEKLAAGQSCRLPTEAEWEYACRAGSEGAYGFGDDVGELKDFAWYIENAGEKTHPVGQKKPNAWGIYDMHGNVYEWCSDWYGPYGDAAQRDPGGAASGMVRVVRGGSWFNIPNYCRSAARQKYPSSGRYDLVGFRVVCVPVEAR